ncbi:hypothetical protein V2I28_03210 [Campylobacter sp. CX2-4080-23]|uniref:hypothetical protein n=1 Tax=Campylobacter porcelli TaxID=1660073 RepID=UPI002EBDD589|nr:hypothetical protein [Campylobacter sp. CX2-4080-23]
MSIFKFESIYDADRLERIHTVLKSMMLEIKKDLYSLSDEELKSRAVKALAGLEKARKAILGDKEWERLHNYLKKNDPNHKVYIED